jgi:hypothetical protein
MTVLWHRAATTTHQISLSTLKGTVRTPKTTGLAAALIATSAALQSAAFPHAPLQGEPKLPLVTDL